MSEWSNPGLLVNARKVQVFRADTIREAVLRHFRANPRMLYQVQTLASLFPCTSIGVPLGLLVREGKLVRPARGVYGLAQTRREIISGEAKAIQPGRHAGDEGEVLDVPIR